MNYEFKILALTDDRDFSISLATECNKYGFSLSFIDKIVDIKNELDDKVIAVTLLDLSNSNVDSFKLGEKIKLDYGIPLFGVLDNFSKKVQVKAKESGFDLIFTKKMLLKSIREVVIHVSNE
tara:strand:- start:353 stop:718 length:366 start_codon:yes stop_codon:yes gene_type:complete